MIIKCTKRIIQIIDKTNEVAFKGASLLFFPMTLIVMYEVIMRYSFNRPTIWAWDVNVQLFCAIVVLGAGHVMKKAGHVSMDIFVSRMKKKAKLLINIGIYTWLLIAMIPAVKMIFEFFIKSIKIHEHASTLLGPPVYPIKFVVLLGIVLLYLQFFSLLLETILSLVEKRKEEI